MRTLLIVATATVLLGSFHLVTSQSQRSQNVSMPQAVRDAREQPHLGIEYSSAVKFKLISRKSSYHIGEIVSLDIAMLNATKEQFFIHKLSGPTVTPKVFDEKGIEVSITPSIIALEGIVPQSYSLLGSGEIIVGSIQMLAGCNVKGAAAFDEARRKLDMDIRQNKVRYDEALFERNLFINWGDTCLRTTQPGIYDVVVEVTNQHVILSARESKVKTAVGTISSSPLRIVISE